MCNLYERENAVKRRKEYQKEELLRKECDRAVLYPRFFLMTTL